MQSRVFVPTYELFFILESFQACFAEYVTAQRPLAGRIEQGLLGCDVYYREDTDVALLALRFDERELDAERLSWILDFAGGAGLAALDPAMLPDEDRRRFYKNYLEEYPLRSEDRRTPEDSLQSLAETLGLRVPRPRVLTSNVVRTPPPQREPAAPVAELAGNDTETVEKIVMTPPPPPLPAPPQPGGARMSTAVTKTWKGSRQHVASALDHIPVIDTIQKELSDSPTKPSARRELNGNRRRYPRASTPSREEPPSAVPVGKVRLGSERDGEPPSKKQRIKPVTGSRPPGVASKAPPPADGPGQISVRFRRGDDWVPARLRSLSLKGAYLACGAPPRLHDDVHVALGLGPLGTVMRGTVVHVTADDEAVSSGASGFGVLFPTIESPSRRQLKELLEAARQRGVVLEPPPPRKGVRFPVRWPVHIVLPNQTTLDLAALDVSMQGMFVSTLDRLPAGALEFFMPTERGGAPIHGRARAVREVPWKMACSRGLHSGFGMEIIGFQSADDDRYLDFVQRVARRVQHRLLVGASPDRTEELVAGLTAAGYTVSGTSDPHAIIKMAECEPRPPDAAVLDSSLVLPPDLAHRIERLFELREVPIINISGEPSYRARAVIDGLLAVHARTV
jgi:hypothetical protein